jgi:DNA-binding transcriptional LysR family regulator
MELRQLTMFKMLATTLSFTRTAAALGYVQSNVSAQIQTLEEELGTPLVDRLGKQIALTDAGQRFLPYVEQVLTLVEEARMAVSGKDEPMGTLTISAPETLCTYRLPHLLSSFQQCYPQVRLLFRPCPVAELRQQVSGGVVDVAFVLEEPLQAKSLVVEPLMREPVVVIAASDHPLTQRKEVGPADLDGERLLLTEVGCGYRNLFLQRLAADGIYPTTVLEFTSVEAIKQCVMARMGITVLPRMAVERELASGQLAALPWIDAEFHVMAQMLWHREKWLSPALRVFLTMAREVLGPL